MKVNGELEQAALEAKATGDYDSSDILSGRVSYDTTTKRVKVGNGTSVDSIPLLSDIATLRDLMHAVGDVLPSVLDTADFHTQYSDNWIKVDGYGIYGGQPEPYLASDYPELAALKPSWVATIDFGGGSKDYLIIPDARSSALLGAEDGGVRTLANVKPEIVSLRSKFVGSVNLQGSGSTTEGLTVPASLPSLTTSDDYVTSALPLLDGAGELKGDDTVGDTYTVSNLKNSAIDMSPAPTSDTFTIGGMPTPQGLAVNFYIKARESV